MKDKLIRITTVPISLEKLLYFINTKQTTL